MIHIHVAAVTFDVGVVMAAFRELPVGHLHLIDASYSMLAPEKPVLADTLRNLLGKPAVTVHECKPDFMSIHNLLCEILDPEIRAKNPVYINVASGTKVFTAAATLAGYQLGAELYYVATKSYFVERNYSSGIEAIVKLPPFAEPPRAILGDSHLCFIAMPFSDVLQAIYSDIICEVVRQKGLQPVRADDFFAPRPIMDDVWDSIERSRLVIADLTGRNPNVFYEVGIAHALGKVVILLAQSLDDIPFDLRHMRCILYSDTVAGAGKLKSDLGAFLDNSLEKTKISDIEPGKQISQASSLRMRSKRQ